METTTASQSTERAGSPAVQRAALIWIVAGLAALVLTVNILSYLPFLADDALISLRYSQRLLQGHGLTWTGEGQPVEGYSNFLWVLAVAGMGGLGFDLVTGARILGIAGMFAAAVAILYRARGSLNGWRNAVPPLAGMLVISLAGPTAAWGLGGLEQGLLAGLLAWSLVLVEPEYTGENLSYRRLLLAGLLYGLLSLTRPDGILFAGMACAAVFFARGFRRESFRAAFALALLPVLLYAGQIVFRQAYYGEWVPNTALVKVSLSRAHLRDGLAYLQQGLLSFSPLIELAGLFLFGGLLFKQTRPRLWVYLFSAGAWLGYIALVGGDIFPAWRHLVPVVVLMGLLVAEGSGWLLRAVPGPRQAALLAAFLMIFLVYFGYAQAVDPENQRAREETWEWDGKVVGLALKAGFGAQAPLLAVEPGGCVPFWSELPSIDMLGLNDYYIPRHPPETFGQGWIGHELGDGQYVLSRQPDLVLFCLPTGSADPCFVSGKQMSEDPNFQEQFTLVNFEAGPSLVGKPRLLTSKIWVRRMGGNVGIQQSEGRFEIPAYLFNGSESSRVVLDGQNRWVVKALPGQPARLSGLRLLPGTWQVQVEGDNPALVRVSRTSNPATLLTGDSPPGTPFTLTKAMIVDISIFPLKGETSLTRVIVTQAGR